MKLASRNRGFTIVELSFSSAVFSIVGATLYSLVNMSTVLGAKNTAINTAHEQARTAMVQMLQDLHSAISLPYLLDSNGNQISGAGPAAGIGFQQWSSGPHKITSDVATTQNQISLTFTSGAGPAPVVGQRLLVPTHQIEDDVTAVSGSGPNYTVTLAHSLPVAITGTSAYTIVCFFADRCSYTVANGNLQWTGPTTKKSVTVLGSDITSSAPFSTPTTAAGALYYRFVSAINLSTADPAYSNRGFKAANIFLNGQIPMRARLATYQ
jgi:type II secretory pathway pseudopilin PulG